MSVTILLAEVESCGAIVSLADDRLILDMPEQFPVTLVKRLRDQKWEVMAHLREQSNSSLKENYRQQYPANNPSTNELGEIERQVIEEGVCLVWAKALDDFVAFYRCEADRAKIPPGFVPYSDAELFKLFAPNQKDIPINALRLIHAAKKTGARITGVEPDTA